MSAKKSPDYRALVLSKNNSNNPACILALPASQSCQVRSVDEISAAAAVCVNPAASRAARILAGGGFSGEHMLGEVLGIYIIFYNFFCKSFGCLARKFCRIEIFSAFPINAIVSRNYKIINRLADKSCIKDCVDYCMNKHAVASCQNVQLICCREKNCSCRRKSFGEIEGRLNRLFEVAHDFLRLLSGCVIASHERNYTRIPCNSKRYFVFSENNFAGSM